LAWRIHGIHVSLFPILIDNITYPFANIPHAIDVHSFQAKWSIIPHRIISSLAHHSYHSQKQAIRWEGRMFGFVVRDTEDACHEPLPGRTRTLLTRFRWGYIFRPMRKMVEAGNSLMLGSAFGNAIPQCTTLDSSDIFQDKQTTGP